MATTARPPVPSARAWRTGSTTPPHYQFIVLQPFAVGNLAIAELTAARSRRLDFALDESAKASWAMPGRHPQTRLVDELETDILVSRDGVALFRGRTNASEDTLSANVHTTTFAATDYRGMLYRRIAWPGSTVTFAAVDQAQIAAQLIRDAETRGPPLGISTSGPINTAVLRDRTYDVGANVGELIANLGRVQNGFDWDVSPDLRFRVWWPARGTQTVTFTAEYGRTVTDVRRTIASGEFANALRFSGDDGVPAVTRVITPGNEGRWEDQQGDTDLTTTKALNETADGAIVRASNLEPSYQLTLTPGIWSPGLVWLGDLVRIVIRSGRLDVNTTSRVVAVSIDLGEDGQETVQLQVARYRWRLTDRLADYQYRLDRLERR